MNIVHEFPHGICEVAHCEIPLADDTRLAARLWLPDDAQSNPVPAILEYLPIAKGDGTAINDQCDTATLPVMASRRCASTSAAAGTRTAY